MREINLVTNVESDGKVFITAKSIFNFDGIGISHTDSNIEFNDAAGADGSTPHSTGSDGSTSRAYHTRRHEGAALADHSRKHRERHHMEVASGHKGASLADHSRLQRAKHLAQKQGTTRFSGSQSDFINRITPAAKAASQETGIDWRIIAAQAAHESGYGKHSPGNMIFGVKAGRGYAGETQTLRTHEVIGGQSVAVHAKFRKYSSIEESVKDYTKVMGGKLGRGVRAASGLEDQLTALGRSGYATDPNYHTKISNIAKSLHQSESEK